MPFGQYRGLYIRAIALSDPYNLRWLLANCRKLRARLRHAIEAALQSSAKE